MNLASSATGVATSIAWSLVAIMVIAAYWIPAIIAIRRRHVIPNVASVVVINMFTGWTGVGWAVALAMAVRSPRPAPFFPQQGNTPR